jgi:hypothetical protein
MTEAAMRRALRPLVVFALTLALAGSAWAECLTGDLTPEQMACCAAMNHDCGAAGVEMGCCATDPQTPDRMQAVSSKPDPVVFTLLKGPLALLPEPHLRLHPPAAGTYDREALKLPDRPTYLLLSVFLI